MARVDSSALFGLAPRAYVPHPLHDAGRDWPETNCYIDLWIELVHALELDPHAMLPFTLTAECEGDQWTFYKPRFSDLTDLYGVTVEELTVWRNLVDQCADQVAMHRVPLVEVDAFHLPDTAGSDYHLSHSKTTIAIVGIDRAAAQLRYFHNAGYFELGGDDFHGVFDGFARQGALPPYSEIVKVDRVHRLATPELVARSLAHARQHFARRPPGNPLHAYAERLSEHVACIVAEDFDTYHRYGFAFVRQLGSCYAFTAAYCRWLAREHEGAWAAVAEPFEAISSTAKTLLLKLARVSRNKKTVDLSPLVYAMAESWDEGMARFDEALSTNAP